MDVFHSDETEQILEKYNLVLEAHEKAFKKLNSNLEPYEYQRAWLMDETRQAIVYAKTRAIQLSVPRVVICEDDFASLARDVVIELQNRAVEIKDTMFEHVEENGSIESVRGMQTSKRPHGWYRNFNSTKTKRFN